MRRFCGVGIVTVEVESMEAPVEMWREKGGAMVSIQNVNGSKNRGDGDDAEPGGAVSQSEYVEMETELPVWFGSSSAAQLRQAQLEVRSTLSCRGATSRN